MWESAYIRLNMTLFFANYGDETDNGFLCIYFYCILTNSKNNQ